MCERREGQIAMERSPGFSDFGTVTPLQPRPLRDEAKQYATRPCSRIKLCRAGGDFSWQEREGLAAKNSTGEVLPPQDPAP